MLLIPWATPLVAADNNISGVVEMGADIGNENFWSHARSNAL